MTTDSPMIIPKDANVLAVCLMGRNRSPKLVEILQENGYQNATKLGIWEPMKPIARQQIIDQADYLVTLETKAASELNQRYRISAEQILIELDIPEYYGEEDAGSRRLRGPEEIYDDIRQQIAPHLTD